MSFAPRRYTVQVGLVFSVLAAACGGDGTTGPDAGGDGGNVPVPAAPTDQSVERIGEGEVMLRWVDRSSDESGFVVERRLAGSGDFAGVGTAGADESGFVDTSVDDATRYRFRIRAANSGGVSAPSNEVAITTPEPLDVTLDAILAVVNTGLPPGDTPTEERDPGCELLAIAPEATSPALYGSAAKPSPPRRGSRPTSRPNCRSIGPGSWRSKPPEA